MSAPTTRQAYIDCYDVFNEALNHEFGIRVRMVDESKATHFRMRMHQARKIVREDNSKVYELGDPMYGASPYDKFSIRIHTDDDGQCFLYVEPAQSHEAAIEPLTAPLTVTSVPMALPKPEAPRQLVSPETMEQIEGLRRRV